MIWLGPAAAAKFRRLTAAFAVITRGSLHFIAALPILYQEQKHFPSQSTCHQRGPLAEDGDDPGVGATPRQQEQWRRDQGLSKRTRHVKVKYLYVQHLVKARDVEVSRVPTETNLADIKTITLAKSQSRIPQSLMGKNSESAMTSEQTLESKAMNQDGNSDDGQHG